MTLQSDPGWLPARRGCLTTSRFKDARAKLKSGKPAEARIQYAMELVAERVSDWAVSRFVTDAMQRGIDLEPDAIRAYETHTGYFCQPAQLIQHASIGEFLSTPDGLIGGDGLVEVKVPSITKFVRWRSEGIIPEEHLDQLQGQQAVCRREWTDFVAYCPEMPNKFQLFLVRYMPTAVEMKQVDADAREFLDLVEEMFSQFVTGQAA